MFRIARFASKLVKVPHMADSISEGTLKVFSKKVGDYVRADEEIASIETDKVDVPVNSPVSGKILKIYVKEEDTVSVGADLCDIDTDAIEPKSEKQETVPKKQDEQKQEIVQPKEQTIQQKVEKVEKMEPKLHKPQEKREKMSMMRQKIAQRLKESQSTAAALTTFNEVDMTKIIEMRNQNKEELLKEGIKLGFMGAFIKAVCYANNHVPVVLARIENNEIVYSSSVDCSVAVATPKGLVTPVIRNCNQKSLKDLEQELSFLAQKAKLNKIEISDLQGGNFTISNGGVFGSLFGTPIINQPQSAILGMHSIKERVIVLNGKIEIRPMMYVCLTYDHRLIDGREAVTFLSKLKSCLEDPVKMLF